MGRVSGAVGRTTSWRETAGPARWAVAVLLGSIALYVGSRMFTHPTSFDVEVYRVEGDAVRSGLDLYGPLPTPLGSQATYPPFAAMLFVPLGLVGDALMRALVLALNLVLLTVVAGLSCRLAGVEPRRSGTVACIVAAAGAWSEPVYTTLRYGQINLLLLALVLWDFTRPDSSRARGIGVGVAAAIKVTPGIFIVYLLLTRRFRSGATAIVTLLLATGVSATVLPRATWKYWTKLLFNTDRVGRLENAENQSLRGMMVRITHIRTTDRWELLVTAVVLIAGLWCAVLAHRRLGDGWGLPACAVTGLLIAPVAWSHHWVWCVPIAVLLWQQARQWLPAASIFWTFAVWAVPHQHGVELHFSIVQILLSEWYVVFGILFLSLTAARVWSVGRRPELAGGPPRRTQRSF